MRRVNAADPNAYRERAQLPGRRNLGALCRILRKRFGATNGSTPEIGPRNQGSGDM
jgi:hypothetical protein